MPVRPAGYRRLAAALPPTPISSGLNRRCWPCPPNASNNRSGASSALIRRRRGAGKFFSRCTRPSRWTKTSPSSPSISPTAGIISVALPDVLPRTRFVRALTGVVLLEFANRDAGARSAEIPAWLTDGLSQQLLATGAVEIVLSSPGRTVNGLPESRTDRDRTRHGPAGRRAATCCAIIPR